MDDKAKSVSDAAASRRSIRGFQNRDVDGRLLREILEKAARRSDRRFQVGEEDMYAMLARPR